MRRKRIVLSVVAALAFVGSGAALAVNWDPSFSADLRPADPHPPVSPIVDQTAIGVIDELGRLCRSYDFLYKDQIEGTDVRPVQCGMKTKSSYKDREDLVATPPVGEGMYVYEVRLGPRLVIFSFGSPSARDAWLDAHSPFWGGRLEGDRYVVEVMDRSLFRRIRAALSEATVLARPTRVWHIDGDQRLEAVREDIEPEISLGDAMYAVSPPAKELLGAALGLYSDTEDGSDPVPAWVITVRRCVAAYEGPHDDPGCVGDQIHTIVDATTGEFITEVIVGD